MENAVLVGLSRQMALSNELDVVANNIANINTTGFKADSSLFEEYLISAARQDDVPGAGRRVSFVQDRGTWHNLGQGAIEATGNPLDVAIVGNAFLAVQTPRGERYTRNGSMQINASGQLVTGDGMPILGDNGPITFQPLDRDIIITADGRISVKEGNSVTESLRGKLRLVGFADPQRLQKDGANTFAAPNGVQPQPSTTAHVTQGTVEKSNVNSVLEISRMIEITRAYTQISTLLQQQSDTHKSAIQQLADVPN